MTMASGKASARVLGFPRRTVGAGGARGPRFERHWVEGRLLRHIVSQWSSDDVRGVSSRLFLIATDGQSWGADLLALRLLAQHGIGDPEWIAGWLGFKREYHERRLADIAGIVEVLKNKALPDAAVDGGLQEP